MLDFNKTADEIKQMSEYERNYYMLNELICANRDVKDGETIKQYKEIAAKWGLSRLTTKMFHALKLSGVESLGMDDAITIRTYIKCNGNYNPILSCHAEPAEDYETFESSVTIDRSDNRTGSYKKAAVLFNKYIGTDKVDAFMSEDRQCFYLVICLDGEKPVLCKIKDGNYEATTEFKEESINKLTDVRKCTLAYKLAVREMFNELRKKDEAIKRLEGIIEFAHNAHAEAMAVIAKNNEERKKRFKWLKWFKK